MRFTRSLGLSFILASILLIKPRGARAASLPLFNNSESLDVNEELLPLTASFKEFNWKESNTYAAQTFIVYLNEPGQIQVTDYRNRGDHFDIYDNRLWIGKTSNTEFLRDIHGFARTPKHAIGDSHFSQGIFGLDKGTHIITIKAISPYGAGSGAIRLLTDIEDQDSLETDADYLPVPFDHALIEEEVHAEVPSNKVGENSDNHNNRGKNKDSSNEDEDYENKGSKDEDNKVKDNKDKNNKDKDNKGKGNKDKDNNDGDSNDEENNYKGSQKSDDKDNEDNEKNHPEDDDSANETKNISDPKQESEDVPPEASADPTSTTSALRTVTRSLKSYSTIVKSATITILTDKPSATATLDAHASEASVTSAASIVSPISDSAAPSALQATTTQTIASQTLELVSEED